MVQRVLRVYLSDNVDFLLGTNEEETVMSIAK